MPRVPGGGAEAMGGGSDGRAGFGFPCFLKTILHPIHVVV